MHSGEISVPPGLNESTTPAFNMAGSNFTCLLREGNGTQVGVIERARCQTTTNVTSWANATQLRHGAQDLYWLCGRRALLRLPRNWRGTCVLMQFVIPVTMVGTREKVATTNMTSQGRQKREVAPGQRAPNWDLTDDKHTWIDAIGVPRGVPNTYKLADNVAAGFESFPVWSPLLTTFITMCRNWPT